MVVMEHCEIPRWQLIKNQLNNLDFEGFVEAFQKEENAICLDVRTEAEYAQWHIDGAQNLSYLSTTLADDLEQLDPKKTYFVYCRTSRRSLRICQLMRNSGFQDVYHLKDGIKEHLGE